MPRVSRINRYPSAPRTAVFLLLFLLGARLLADDRNGVKTEGRPGAATPWEVVGSTDGVVICSRTRAGSKLKEFRSVGEIDAPSSAVFAVLDDSEAYPSFMPYTSECRVLKKTEDGDVTYQRLGLPWVCDRDYTLRSKHWKSPGPAGPIYRIRWESANNLGPAQKPGVERVLVCEGSWLLEPSGAATTRATYLIYSATGGFVPAFIANRGSQIAIRKVFDAIRKEAREPKYAAASGK